MAENLDEFLNSNDLDESDLEERELRFSFDYVEEASQHKKNDKKKAKSKLLANTNLLIPDNENEKS